MSQRPVRNQLFQSLGCALCLMALLATVGTHWMALQSFAWVQMFGRYAREGSLISALAKTFDGRHPCNLCRAVQLGRQHEQQEQAKQPLLKLGEAPDLFCDLQPTRIPPPTLTDRKPIPFLPDGHADFLDAPPTPPPRAG